MAIPKIVSDTFNWHTIFGKFAWAIVAIGYKWIWTEFKKLPEGMKRQVILTVTGVVGVVLLLTLVSQITASLAGDMQGQNRPEFNMVLTNPNLADTNPRTHILSLDAKIWNSGGQSAVLGWSLTIKGQDGQSFQFPQMVPLGTNSITALNPDGTFSRVFLWPDSLQSKAGEVPIEHGALRSGYVMFQISDTAREFLLSPMTKYSVSCQDIVGRVYTVEFNWPAPSK